MSSGQLADRLAQLVPALQVRQTVIDDDYEPDEDILVYRAAAIARRHRERWERLAPLRFRTAALEHVDPAVVDHLAGWSDNPDRPNLLLAGPVGVGKTWAALAVCRPLIESGATCAYWPLVELLDQLRPGGQPETWADTVDLDLLILDDLGTERPTDWTAERLYALVNRRWAERRPIVATTNLRSPELRQALGERTYSRLVGGALVVRLSGEDRRRQPTTQPQEEPTT